MAVLQGKERLSIHRKNKVNKETQLTKTMELLYCDASMFSRIQKCPGPSCSKLMTSLANDSLKFTSSDTQIC